MRIFGLEINRKHNKIAPQQQNAINKESAFEKFASTSIPNFIAFNDFGKIGNRNDLALLELYNIVAEVNGVVTYLAQVASSIPLKHVTIQANGKYKEVKDSPILKLLAYPNSLKGGRSMRLDLYSSFMVFGNVYLNASKPFGFSEIKEIWQLPSYNTFPIPAQSQDQYGTPKFGSDFRTNPISYYNFFVEDQPKRVEIVDMLHIKDSNLNVEGNNAYIGQSRLYSAIDSCETLKYLYETINTILTKRGALGFIKKNNRAGELSTTLSSKEIDQILDAIQRRYGVTGGRQPIGVVNTDVSYQRVDAAISEFMPIELKNDMVRTLCRCLGNIPPQLFGIVAASTYNNLTQMEKQLYTSCVNPIVELFCNEYSKFFGLDKINQLIVPDYSKIDALQEDKKLKAESEKIINENYKYLLDNGLITREYWATQIGLPTTMIVEPNTQANADTATI